MAQWKLTLYNNTLSSKSGNVVPCCPTIEAKRAFRNSLQVTVPPENLAIIDRNTFFNTDVQRLTVEFDEAANPLCYRSNYAVVEINIPGGGVMYYYYWIDNIQYMNSIDKTANISKGASMVAVLELSKDVWQSEFFREEYRKDEGWVLAMPKIKALTIGKTNHNDILTKAKQYGGGGDIKTLPEVAPHASTIFKTPRDFNRYIIVYVATITVNEQRGLGLEYEVNSGAFFYFADPNIYSASQSEAEYNAMLAKIMRLNTSGKLQTTSILPPGYPTEIIQNGNFYVHRAFILPFNMGVSNILYNIHDYKVIARFDVGEKSITETLGVLKPSFILQKTFALQDIKNIVSDMAFCSIGSTSKQITLPTAIDGSAAVNFLNGGTVIDKAHYSQGHMLYPRYSTPSAQITIRVCAGGDGLSVLLSNGKESIDLTDDWTISAKYSYARESARQSVETAKASLLLSTIMGVAGAAAGGGVGLLAFAGSAGNAIIQGQNIAQRENELRNLAPASSTSEYNTYAALKFPVCVCYCPPPQNSFFSEENAVARATIFSENGTSLNIKLDDNLVKSLAFTPPHNADFAFISGTIKLSGQSQLEEYCQNQLNEGVTFIYF